MNHGNNGSADVDVDADFDVVDKRRVRAALRKINLPADLARLPLAESAMVEERLAQMRLPRGDEDRGYALAKIIKETLAETFPADEQPAATFPADEQSAGAAVSERALMGMSLTQRYMEEKPREVAAKVAVGRSLSGYDRLHDKALQILTEALHSRNDEPARRRRARQNPIEEILGPINRSFENQRYEEVITGFRRVAPRIYDFGFSKDYLDVARKAVHAAEKTGKEGLAAEIKLRDIARVHIDLKKFEEAETEATLALAMAEPKGKEMYHIQAEAYRILGTVKRERKDYPGSIKDLNKSQAIFQKCGEPVRCLDVRSIRVVTLRRWGHWEKAEAELLALLARYSRLKGQKEEEKETGEAIARCRLGTLCYERAITKYAADPQKLQEELARARAEYQRAVELDKKLGRRRSVAFDNKKLALVEMAAGNLKEAGERLQEAEGFFAALGYPDERKEIKKIKEKLEDAGWKEPSKRARGGRGHTRRT